MTETVPPEYSDEVIECFKLMSEEIHRFLRNLTQGDKALAADLVQVTFEKAWKAWPELRGLSADARAGWLMTVAFNSAIDSFRRAETAEVKLPQIYFRYGRPDMDVHREAMTSIAIRRFVEVIDQMPPQQARVAFLSWRCGWSQNEIATALGISPGRVSQLVSTARDRLKSELSSYVPFDSSKPEGGA